MKSHILALLAVSSILSARADVRISEVTPGELDARTGIAWFTYQVADDGGESVPRELRAMVVDRSRGYVLGPATAWTVSEADPLSAGEHTLCWNVLADAPSLSVGKLGLRLSAEAVEGEETEESETETEVEEGVEAAEPPADAPVAEVPAVPPLPGDGLYMVIDVSGGIDAESWPVEFLEKEPEGGWDVERHRMEKIVLRRVPAGSAALGPLESDFPGAQTKQRPTTLTKDYYIGIYPLTQKQWEYITGKRPEHFEGRRRPVDCVSYQALRGAEKGANWPASSEVDDGSAIGVLRRKTGLATLDLPTEAQWEYACRAGQGSALNSGKDLGDAEKGGDELREVAQRDGGTGMVGGRKPNGFGLYDMHGMVWEWCLDRYAEDLGSDVATDPKGPAEGGERVARGGAWNEPSRLCTSAARMNYAPDHDRAGNTFNIGARIVVGVP